MTLDEAVALSLVPFLSRVGLTERLVAGDLILLDEAARRRSAAREVRLRAEAAGIGVLPWNDVRFPSALLQTSDAPPVLYYRGTIDVFSCPSIAIVGSRTASAVALETAGHLAADLAARGVAVVSGLARGVDSAAHRGALRTGRTVAVLGSGVDCIYPREHAQLASAITGAGVIVSEHPPGTAPLPFHFPLRNRIISGLSRAVVIVEASEQSGSLITASCALEQGRDVMAVPGNVLSGRNKGAHALLRDGAKIVECADDILEELGWSTTLTEAHVQESSASTATTSGEPLLQQMRCGEPYDLDALAALTGLAVSRVLPRLLELELQGVVQRVDGGRFMRPTRPC